jgi:hypothetical protein
MSVPVPVPISAFNHHRGRVAALSRSRTADDPELVDARQNMRAERLAAYIQRQLAAAPPLSSEMIETLATLLRGGANDAA